MARRRTGLARKSDQRRAGNSPIPSTNAPTTSTKVLERVRRGRPNEYVFPNSIPLGRGERAPAP